MKYNGKNYYNISYLFRMFEVRGNHNEYKVPEIKSTDVTKKTKATVNRLQSISLERNENLKKRALELKERGNLK